jgi:acyl carrier protein
VLARVGVALRPVLPGDHRELRSIELSEHNLTRWRFAGEVPSPEEYRRLLWSGVLEQRVVTRSSSPSPIGLVNAHRADLRSGTAWLGVVERQDLHGQGLGMAGLAMFVDWLFDQWPLRHLHAEVHEDNLGQFESVLDGFANVAGRLRARFRDEGAGRDAVLVTIARDMWLSTARMRIRTTLHRDAGGAPISFGEVCDIAARSGAVVSNPTPDTELADIGLDSLAVILVLDELEQRVGAPLPAGEEMRVRTLGDLVTLARASHG